MTGKSRYEVAIIGGGIIGMATAMALVNRFQISLIVLEAEDRLATHQTGHNSGVIHSGLYYKPGSSKARHCILGREAMYRFCRKHDIPHERCGKIIVAVSEQELPVLEDLERRGSANGIKGIRKLRPEEVREYEAHVDCVAGLFIPETGIVNYAKVADVFAGEVRGKGGDIFTGTQVMRCRRERDGLVLETSRGEVRCRFLVNCGGLQSDRIARLCGLDPGVKIVPFRGEYYRLIPERRYLVNNLVYPVPDPAFPFLGVHFTRTIEGDVEIGPNAVLALKREGYEKWSFSVKDALEVVTYRGFWKLVRRYLKTGIGEFYRSLNPAAFVKALQRMIPDLKVEDLCAGGAGVRAQALDANGFLLNDFHIVEAERMIHVLNAPSPAATASISIGESIAHLAGRKFEFVEREFVFSI